MILEISFLVVPVCYGNKNKKWTILPKAYKQLSHANSAIRAHKRIYKNAIFRTPIYINKEIEVPDCEDCPQKFMCFTER